ncbi:DUF2953 domain-containing protein [Bacillus thermotolerans]|uniref:DUF2953 domain-containing protein n=1 Tax=Bacillus thermotolerans TaxID=1221996 RepID=UPI0005837556|nr:DUF2953 domain-containing protein [Bacillus thermotolerans]KKB37580.1 putative secreted protein [Bacillus thermotolerans]
MLWWISALLAVLWVIWIISRMNIYVLFYFSAKQGNIRAYIRLFLLGGWLRWTIHLPPKEVTDQSLEKANRAIHRAGKEEFNVLLNMLKRVTIQSLRWDTVLGTKDAALTGMVTGVLWAIKGSLSSAASPFMKASMSPFTAVTPVFGRNVLETECSCMISLRAGHAIAGVIQLLRLGRRLKSQQKAAPILYKTANREGSR